MLRHSDASAFRLSDGVENLPEFFFGKIGIAGPDRIDAIGFVFFAFLGWQLFPGHAGSLAVLQFHIDLVMA